MKLTAILATLLLIPTLAFGALTAQEEATVTQLHNNKQKVLDLITDVNELKALASRATNLSNIADGITNETVPIQVKQLQVQKDAVIAQRDADIQANNVANDNANQIVFDSAQVNLDTLEAQITALRNSI